MLYSVLIYDSEAIVTSRTQQQDDALVARHVALQQELMKEGKLGPVIRLMPTTTATTVRPRGGGLVLDGPFAETKEQLLGLYLVDCQSYEEAVATARRIAACCLTLESGCVEVRPLNWFRASDGSEPQSFGSMVKAGRTV